MLINKEEMKTELQEFKSKIRLPNITIPIGIEALINSNRDLLKSKSKQDLALDNIELAQYSTYLRMEINRLEATTSWCTSNIEYILGKELPSFGDIWYQEKLQIVKSSTEAIVELEKLKSSCKIKLHMLQDIDKKLDYMSKAINSLMFVKE